MTSVDLQVKESIAKGDDIEMMSSPSSMQRLSISMRVLEIRCGTWRPAID